jgi:phosphoribosyl 1,2-cyclic phosphodiesterase
MKLFTTAIASGSNGNCYYVGNENEAVLIDAGISCREIEQRMKRLELSMHKVKALFISHEHTDHIRGARVLSKKYKLPVYLTPATLLNANLDVSHPFYVHISPHVPVKIGKLNVTAFPKYHDARDPQSFIIQQEGIGVGVFTDIGEPCENVISYLKLCHALYLETNYDEKMLAEGRYPYFLKKRITGGKGHLSNRQALELLQQHGPEYLRHIFLSHLSGENNHPDVALNMFQQAKLTCEIVLTSRQREIPVYAVSAKVKVRGLV